MRILTDTLLAAQKASAVEPYVKVVATNGVTTYTFDNLGIDGADRRVKIVETSDEPFGGNASIQLDNSDKYFADKNLKGYDITLSWGANTTAGYEVSAQAPLFVLNQRDTSQEGELLTVLTCLDLWWKIAYTCVVRAGYRLTGRVTAGLELGELVTGSNSAATGRLVEITATTITLTSVTGAFELAEDAEGATAGCYEVTAIDAVSGGSGTDYGRNETILAIMNAILPTGIDAILDSDDPDSTINTYKPLLVTEVGTNARQLIRQLLQMSKCNAVIKADGDLHILYPDPLAAVDYTYQTDHVFWYQLRDRAVILPNTVLFVNHLPGSVPDGEVQYAGTANDAYSLGRLGELLADIQVNPTIQSNDEATALAEAWIAQRLSEAYQGGVRAPMHCGQELYDNVSIVDARSGVTVTGRVGKIVRRYQSPHWTLTDPTAHVYEIEVTLGGIVSNPGDTGGPGTLDMDLNHLGTRNIKQKNPPFVPDWSTILPKAIQGYRHDIVFSETDYNTVEWTSGTITFYDGTTQAVASGNTGNLATAAIYYIYFDLDDASPNVLKVVADYVAVFDQQTGLMCMVQRGSDSDIAPTIIPSYGKEPLITADIIDMTGLKEYEFGDGTKLQSIFSTQISAGYIKLTADTVKSGEWYNESGVEIDAANGINIYGTDAAFTTRATKTGTIQCKVDSSGNISAGAGKVLLNSTGIHINGAGMLIFDYSDTEAVGGIGATSASILQIIANNKMQLAGGTGASEGIEVVGCNGATSGFRPASDDYTDLGLSNKRWHNFHCIHGNMADLTIGSTALSEANLIALLALL